MKRRELVIPSDPRIWLASWPRCGSTLLRLILYHCFGMKSATAYEKDITGEFSAGLSRLVDGGTSACKMIKAHDAPPNNWPAIYVVRDGREACVSYMRWMEQTSPEKKGPPLRWVIEGHPTILFGTWSDHLRQWHPLTRPQTLLLTYEGMVAAPSYAIRRIAEFLNAEPIGCDLPTFASLHKALPTFFRSGTNETWRDEMTGSDLDLFWEIHGEAMGEYGYA